MILIKQGAEAKVYYCPSYYPTPLALPRSSSSATTSTQAEIPLLIKHRFKKAYRHPILDAQLTKQRLQTEARALLRCLKYGIVAPKLRFVDLKGAVLAMEFIRGPSIREILGGGLEDDLGEEEDERGEESEAEIERDGIVQQLFARGLLIPELLRAIGNELAKMHLAEIIHGDLTTSNMMVRLLPSTDATATPSTSATPSSSTTAWTPPKFIPSTIFEIVIIDFGLSSISQAAEDKAVDLYVLERAFASTHPVPLLPNPSYDPSLPATPTLQYHELIAHAEKGTDGGTRNSKEIEGRPLFEILLEGYRNALQERKKGEWERVGTRLEEVRGRGRKRSMVG